MHFTFSPAVCNAYTTLLYHHRYVPQITPHILIFWRPDVSSFTAYMIRPAAPGAKLAANVSMTLLPDVRGQQKAAEGLKILSRTLNDDSEAFDFLCPIQVNGVTRHVIDCMPRINSLDDSLRSNSCAADKANTLAASSAAAAAAVD